MNRSFRILITAGPTHEPIDPVRFIGNRSSGKMGAAIAQAAIAGGHEVTLICGPVNVAMPAGVHRIDIETAAQMESAVLEQFPAHDLLIMAAAVADFRPISVSSQKLGRGGSLTIQCEPTPDIVAKAASVKRPDQRIIGFSLESEGGVERAKEKLKRKGLDLIVFNPLETISSPTVGAVLLYPDGRSEALAAMAKTEFAEIVILRAREMLSPSA
jgi:phosphopantothenoylcysteine decarboxylase/phosphopantothenate--cysteine ligase